MRTSVVKPSAQMLFESRDPRDVISELLKIRAILLKTEAEEYLGDIVTLDLFFLDLCAYFSELETEEEK